MTSVVLVNGDPLTTGRWEECGVRNTRCLVKAVNFQAIRENYLFSFYQNLEKNCQGILSRRKWYAAFEVFQNYFTYSGKYFDYPEVGLFKSSFNFKVILTISDE